MTYYYQKHNVILAKTPQWSKEKYGFDTESKGDCIFRTALYTISHPGSIALEQCRALLTRQKRWPYELVHELDHKYRSINSMTRDPYIMYLSAIILNGYIHHVCIPWYLYRPYLYNWQEFLFTNNYKYRKRFVRQLSRTIKFGLATRGLRNFVEKYSWLRWTRHKFGIHSYSLHLWAWMAYTSKSRRMQRTLLPLVPIWNDLLRILCNDKTPGLIEIAKRYTSRQGYQWTEDHILVEKDFLPVGDAIKMDKDILEWVIGNEKL